MKDLRQLRAAMASMKNCKGACGCVPDEVSGAVSAAVKHVPTPLAFGEEAREARAVVVAERMVAEDWSFCPCFPEERTKEHSQIYKLVNTNMANRIAYRYLLAKAKAA